MLYTDTLRHWRFPDGSVESWCHLASDQDLNELHHMATQLSLPSNCFHISRSYSWYELTPWQKVIADQLGANSVSNEEMKNRCCKRRSDVHRHL